MNVFCDFDGTITTQDTTDFILNRFASPVWEAIEMEWKQGLIGSAECMQRQIALIQASPNELEDALNSIEIDVAFCDFVRFCESSGISITIISDGVDYFIQKILKQHRLDHLPIIANRLIPHGKNCYQLTSPFAMADCQSKSGVCKCHFVGMQPFCVYVGDGRSDFCTADKADLVFAKSSLATHCQQKGIAFIPYQGFSDVTLQLQSTLPHLNSTEFSYKSL